MRHGSACAALCTRALTASGRSQVEALLRRGKRVRALVRDEAKGRQLLVRPLCRGAFCSC